MWLLSFTTSDTVGCQQHPNWECRWVIPVSRMWHKASELPHTGSDPSHLSNEQQPNRCPMWRTFCYFVCWSVLLCPQCSCAAWGLHACHASAHPDFVRCLAEQDQQSVSCQALLWWGTAVPTTCLAEQDQQSVSCQALLWWGTAVPTTCLAEQDQQSVSCQALLWRGIAISTTSLWGGCHHHKHEKPALKQEREELKLPLVMVILYTHPPVQDSLLTTASAPYVQWRNVLIAVPSPPQTPFPCDVFARSGFLYLPSKTFSPQGQWQHEASGNNQPCMEDMHRCVSVKLSCKSLIQHACAVQSNAIRVPCKDWLGDFVHGPARSVRCAKHIVFCTTTNRLICTHTLCSSFPVWATDIFRKDWLHPRVRVDSCKCA